MFNVARSMLFYCDLPLSFWGDAVEYAVYILNRSPTSADPKRMSPMEMITGKAADLTDIVIFGSPCTVYREKKVTGALTKRGAEGYILGEMMRPRATKYCWQKNETLS